MCTLYSDDENKYIAIYHGDDKADANGEDNRQTMFYAHTYIELINGLSKVNVINGVLAKMTMAMYWLREKNKMQINTVEIEVD